MGRKPKILKLREDYRPLLLETKKLFPTLLGHVKTKRIALVGMYARKSGFIGRIFANRPPYSLLVEDYDYLIMFWSTRFDDKPHSYKIYVMLHELAHITEGGFVNGAPDYRKCIRHDIEEFTFLAERYGINLENVKDVMKGEKHLLNKDGVRRFPRVETIH